MTVQRPLGRYHGSKWRLAPWIIGNLPAHDVYCEPFAGSACVLMRKPRSRAEIINDLNREIVHLFRVLRDPDQARRLCEMVSLTPYARAELDAAMEPSQDPVEQARRTLVRLHQSRTGEVSVRSWVAFRSRSWAQRAPCGAGWGDFPEHLVAIVERLRGVCIECMPAVDLIRLQDHPDTLFYCDPPYALAVRGRGRYIHDMDDEEHAELADVLRSIQGMSVVSGYPTPLYDALFAGWERVGRQSIDQGGGAREECLWLSSRTSERLHRTGLFAMGGKP